jgi:hypothetical protein
MHAHPLTVRAATRRDARDLRILAALDGASPLRGKVLLAELDCVPIAAISLATGSLIADPARDSDQAVRKLRLCRYQLSSQTGRRPLRSVLALAA